MKVAVIDYGMGNLGSVRRALAELGVETIIARQPEELASADKLVLPGVGSFSDGMAQLTKHGWAAAIREETGSGKPLLGICLGMQLLASRGTEGGNNAGLDLVPGEVKRLDALGSDQRIPHVGWNNIQLRGQSQELFAGISSGTDFYFVHSFAFEETDPHDVIAKVDYGVSLTAAIARGPVFGTQFHPEKSSKAGFRLLRNFLDFQPC
jgi:glutamine amidotransferase